MSADPFEKAFPGRKAVFLIALHVTPEREQWESDIEIARSEGADGIIVIRDYTTLATDEDALSVYAYARKLYPDWHIGLNLLGHTPDEAVLRPKTGVSSFWFDEVYIEEDKEDGARYFAGVRTKSDVMHLQMPPLLIPSVAMKYRTQPKSLARVARLVEPYADIIVTSGEKTGEAPDIEKVNMLREAVSCPIGIVSGTSVNNADMFMAAGVNCFIVWTSIARKTMMNGNRIEVLDRPKVGALRAKIR